MSTITQPKLRFNITAREGDPESVTMFHGGKEYVATREHPNFNKILFALNGADKVESIIGMFDLTAQVKEKMGRLSERVLVVGGHILFDGEQIDNVLASTILSFYQQDIDDWKPLVSFMEKLMTNPSERSRAQLFSWLQRNKFSIDQDGDIIAYKGVHRNTGRNEAEDFLSVSSGRAIVNGRWVTGKIPTSPGTIVEMPRSEVVDDPNEACHRGLHAGDWSYASTFAHVTLRVKINPRDVVSVPNDNSFRKMRTCRYRVLNVVDSSHEDTGLVFLGKDELRTRALPVESKPTPKSTTQIAKKVAAKKPAKRAVVVEPPKAAKQASGPVKKAAPRTTPKVKGPKFYEEFKLADFVARPFNELRWLAGEWDLKKPLPKTKPELVKALARAASARRRKDLKSRDMVKVK